MKADEALAKMVLPSHRRPGIWAGGICQIHVTRNCDLQCTHCTQGSDLLGKSFVMSPDDFETAVKSLDGYFGIRGVFGGNPALSKHFGEYCEILRAHVPFKLRGVWCNHPRGNGAHMRITFNPACSNLNCHLVEEAHAEFSRDWPESIPYLKGMDRDSIHGAPFVAMKDMEPDESKRWDMIASCDINRWWSSLIGIVPGKGLRAFMCEVQYSQASLHADNPDWDGTGQPMPDTGLPVTPGWWKASIETFEPQVRLHCMACGIPMRRPGQLAIGGEREEFSRTHEFIARPKVKSRPVEIVSIGPIERRAEPSTEYLPGTTPKASTRP